MQDCANLLFISKAEWRAEAEVEPMPPRLTNVYS